MSEPFHGIFPYLVSPVDRSGRVREEVLRGLVERLIAGGVHGLSPLGSTGEFPYLTPAQRTEIVRITVDAARGRVPIVPGVAAYATHDAIDQVQRLLDLGIDGVVLILQTYFPLSPPRVLEYFSGVAEAVRCPIVLYSNPKLLGAELTPDHVVALSEIPNVRYFKEASGETGKILTVLNRTAGRMKVFSASAHIPLLVFRLGGVGWMAGPACLLPRECVALYELAQRGRWDEAERLQRRLWALNEVFQRYSLAACVKTGLALQGCDVGDPIPPVAPLGREATDDVRRALEAASTPTDEARSAESAGTRGDGGGGPRGRRRGSVGDGGRMGAPAVHQPGRAILVKACLNGGRRRAEHAAVPVTAEELAADARAVVAAGAAALHVHPRTADGHETLDAAACGAALAAIRDACPGVPVGLSTGAWMAPDPRARLGLIDAWTVLPDFVSVNLSESGVADLCAALIAPPDRHRSRTVDGPGRRGVRRPRPGAPVSAAARRGPAVRPGGGRRRRGGDRRGPRRRGDHDAARTSRGRAGDVGGARCGARPRPRHPGGTRRHARPGRRTTRARQRRADRGGGRRWCAGAVSAPWRPRRCVRPAVVRIPRPPRERFAVRRAGAWRCVRAAEWNRTVG